MLKEFNPGKRDKTFSVPIFCAVHGSSAFGSLGGGYGYARAGLDQPCHHRTEGHVGALAFGEDLDVRERNRGAKWRRG